MHHKEIAFFYYYCLSIDISFLRNLLLLNTQVKIIVCRHGTTRTKNIERWKSTKNLLDASLIVFLEASS